MSEADDEARRDIVRSLQPSPADPALAAVWDRLFGPNPPIRPSAAPPPGCTRTRANGTPCAGRAIIYDVFSPWLNEAGTCGSHLTPAERARRAGDHAAAARAYDLALDVAPECWLWARPTVVDVEHPAVALAEWQAERCAICGRKTWLVEDHDHATGMVRGLLCASDNVREGTNPGVGSHVFAYYRRQPPTAILGITYRYVSSVTGPAIGHGPAPDPANRWKDNPMRGAL